MPKIEAKKQIIFGHWVKNVFKETAAYELKQTKTNSIPFSAVVPHQTSALDTTRNGVFFFKLIDAGYQNPYDCYSMVNEPAYVVIFYPKSFELIPINGFLLEKERSKRKSLTWERAQEISSVSVSL